MLQHMASNRILRVEDVDPLDDFMKRLISSGFCVNILEGMRSKDLDDVFLIGLVNQQYVPSTLKHRIMRQTIEMRVHQYFLSQELGRHANEQEVIQSWELRYAADFSQRYKKDALRAA